MCYHRSMAPDIPLPGSGYEAWIRGLHKVLQRLFHREGRGTIKRVEAAMGISDGSFRQWRRRGRLELSVLFRALEEIDVHPARFWVEVFGGELDAVQLAKRPLGPPRNPVVRRAVARWESPRQRGSNVLQEGGRRTAMTGERLRRLDGLRGEDPAKAVRKIKAALKVADRPWIPRLLAVYGSALRARARLDQALEALHYALLLAECGDRRAVCADMLQRLGAAYAYTGNHVLGLLFAKEAAYQHRMAGNLRGEGRSWVDQGARYFHLGRLDDAIACNRAALHSLPDDEVRNRFSAYQSLAFAHHRKGDLVAAAESVRHAEAIAPKVSDEFVAVLSSTKAAMAITAGDYEQAERCLSAEIDIYRKLSPLDAAAASVDLVGAQILRGRMSSALQTIKDMAAFLQPLKDNPIASEAIMQLIRLAVSGGRITQRILEQVSRQLRETGATDGPRPRRNQPFGSRMGCKPA